MTTSPLSQFEPCVSTTHQETQEMHLQHQPDYITYWPTFQPHQCSDIGHQYNHTPAHFMYWHDTGTCTSHGTRTSHYCGISMVPHCTSNYHAIPLDTTTPSCPLSPHPYKFGPHTSPDTMPVPTIPWYIPMCTYLFTPICTAISLAHLQLLHNQWIV